MIFIIKMLMSKSPDRILSDVKRCFMGRDFLVFLSFFFERELSTWGKGAEEIKNKSVCGNNTKKFRFITSFSHRYTHIHSNIHGESDPAPPCF